MCVRVCEKQNIWFFGLLNLCVILQIISRDTLIIRVDIMKSKVLNILLVLFSYFAKYLDVFFLQILIFWMLFFYLVSQVELDFRNSETFLVYLEDVDDLTKYQL